MRTKIGHKIYVFKFVKLNANNVKDYGAYGDGIHDDTAAIQHTVNAVNKMNSSRKWYKPLSWFNRSFVYFPDGTYKTTGKPDD